MNDVEYTNAVTDADLLEILELQKKNHYTNITRDELDKEGFVTCIHDLDLLRKMNSPFPHVIAKAEDAVVAYALVMTREHSQALAILKTMFDKIHTLTYKGQPLADASYVVMGQICIAKEYRSQGIFQGLYKQMKKQMATHFDYIITEIDDNNKRSLAAHARAGFQTIDTYNAGKDWHIVLLETVF